MKLKCKDHKKRVHVIEGMVYHRDGGQTCPSSEVVMAAAIVPVTSHWFKTREPRGNRQTVA